MCFFSCHRIISHDRIYVERMFWGPPDRFSSPTEKIIAKTIIRICPFRQILSCSNLPTSSVELIWPITELYFRQILSTDFMNRFCQDVKTGPYGLEFGPFSRIWFSRIGRGRQILENGHPYAREAWSGFWLCPEYLWLLLLVAVEQTYDQITRRLVAQRVAPAAPVILSQAKAFNDGGY